MLKELVSPIYDITPAVTTIFSASLQQQTIPDDLRSANVTPVYKKGEKYRTVNYRQISLTCSLCKQMEHIIASQVMSHLNQNNLLYKLQQGFYSKLSCETQLVEFTSDALKTLQDGKQCDDIIMGFSKAFDEVSPCRLIYKLQRIGIGKQTVGWIISFLTDRMQCVVVDGESLDIVPVMSGVPQE